MVRISPGDNTVRVSGYRTYVDGVYDVHCFDLINLDGDIHTLAYKLGAGTLRNPQIIRDLIAAKLEQVWMTIYLKEINRLLAIVSIKEPRLCQNELWDLSRRLVS